MNAARTALLLQLLFTVLSFGWRSLAQRRATGSTGFVAHRERGAVAKAAGLALTAGLLAVVAGTVLAGARGWDATALAGTAAMLGGLVLTLVAQGDMGSSWRIGVDPDERTQLVTRGLFGRVRNPIFTGMIMFAAGSALAVPTGVTVAGFLLATAGIVVQVRGVEEPHLRRQHGPSYDQYVTTTGRFLPRLKGAGMRGGRTGAPLDDFAAVRPAAAGGSRD
jgi:protein-S-isoprenylcysteine O-methyltransferase Ste14